MQIKSQKSKKKATKVTELRFHRALFLANGKHLWRENRPAERKRAGKEVPELEIGEPGCRWTVGHSKNRRIHGTKSYHRPQSAENSTERHRPKNTEPQRRLIEPSTKAEREKNIPPGGSLGRKAHWPMNKIEARSTGEMKKSGQNLADWQKMSTFAPLFSLSQCDGVLPCKKQLE